MIDVLYNTISSNGICFKQWSYNRRPIFLCLTDSWYVVALPMSSVEVILVQATRRWDLPLFVSANEFLIEPIHIAKQMSLG